jgi:hypothetical protein
VPAIRDGDTELIESVPSSSISAPNTGRRRSRPCPRYPAYMFAQGAPQCCFATRFYAPEEQKQNWGAQWAIDLFLRRSRALLRPLTVGVHCGRHVRRRGYLLRLCSQALAFSRV